MMLEETKPSSVECGQVWIHVKRGEFPILSQVHEVNLDRGWARLGLPGVGYMPNLTELLTSDEWHYLGTLPERWWTDNLLDIGRVS